MSEFRVPVVEIGKTGRHPNADRLSITQIEGCPVIFQTGDFIPGDRAIYVPVEAVVPETVPGTEFLGKHRRIKAKKLRGIFSMGLLLPISTLNVATWPLDTGTNVAPILSITKYEEPEAVYMQTDAAPPPTLKCEAPVYDMESYRKYKHLLVEGEPVVVTEKLHGTNSRFVYVDGALHVGSHRGWKKMDERNLWWKMAQKYDLEAKLSKCPGLVFYGETYGQVQDLKYGMKNECKLAFFDIYNSNEGKWLNYNVMALILEEMELPEVPILYVSPYDPKEIEPLCEGKTTIANADNIREGFVIKPINERWNNETGRTIMKLVGEEYLLRKGGTEGH